MYGISFKDRYINSHKAGDLNGDVATRVEKAFTKGCATGNGYSLCARTETETPSAHAWRRGAGAGRAWGRCDVCPDIAQFACPSRTFAYRLRRKVSNGSRGRVAHRRHPRLTRLNPHAQPAPAGGHHNPIHYMLRGRMKLNYPLICTLSNTEAGRLFFVTLEPPEKSPDTLTVLPAAVRIYRLLGTQSYRYVKRNKGLSVNYIAVAELGYRIVQLTLCKKCECRGAVAAARADGAERSEGGASAARVSGSRLAHSAAPCGGRVPFRVAKVHREGAWVRPHCRRRHYSAFVSR
ncbi:hypothetical protein EVAR_88477_1 [Eumeta japonica]|uniref:Uncharacterized protein n=1 Tax=Eumeta variegata TaxID=151549 RepID=A0A4C1XVV2_EUMVA|nr:hypothetical protein EVAR_88477_1 [Eumeta japonica]